MFLEKEVLPPYDYTNKYLSDTGPEVSVRSQSSVRCTGVTFECVMFWHYSITFQYKQIKQRQRMTLNQVKMCKGITILNKRICLN